MGEKYYPIVVQAIPGPEYTVYAYFSDGSIRRLDMKPFIEKGGVFAILNDKSFFVSRLTVLNNTVAWDLSGKYDPTDCIDIDPFELYGAETVDDPLQSAEECAEPNVSYGSGLKLTSKNPSKMID
ncbi:MAG: DUF2442 domain-containing protein [Spirochaetales bacterium]|nr:DUF2442 domain-containing protein [Spirochaetales bacterium]MBQ9810252.1 DUF2442 domain-containing protein [Spirochaetales bacterium]